MEDTLTRSIITYPLSESIQDSLIAAGMETYSHIEEIDQTGLQNLSGLMEEECQQVLEIKHKSLNKINKFSFTVDELLSSRQTYQSVYTGCLQFDQVVYSKGFPIGHVSEISGEAGSGKTQVCLQICANIQSCNSDDQDRWEALYIDTEGSFSSKRFLQMLENNSQNVEEAESKLKYLHFLKCIDVYKFERIILFKLEEFLFANPKVKLVVIDSIAYLFRYDFEENLKEKFRILNNIAQKLRMVAVKYNISVLVTNHVAYDPSTNKKIATLGDFWGQVSGFHVRLMKTNRKGVRIANGIKSLTQKTKNAYFEIKNTGISSFDIQNNFKT